MRGRVGPATEAPCEELLERLWLIRAFEERTSELVASGEVVGLVHLSIGQEASAVGVCDVLRGDDRVYMGRSRSARRSRTPIS